MFISYCISFVCLLVFIQSKKPSGQEEQTVWRLECELGVISDSECPIDGAWTPWSPWSACSGSCDEVGHRRRDRDCNNPPPSKDGLPCTGADHQTEPCYLNNCTIEDFRKLVEGDIIRSDVFRELETNPYLMDRCLKMECPFEAIEAALANDNTWQINPETLWNYFQCVKHNLGCPIIGEWGSWSEWSSCGARCGYGLRWRTRKCDTPPPSNAQLMCKGTPLQVDECQGDQCSVNKRDSSGKWSDWGPWSDCSENCGLGIRKRKRTCLESKTPRLLFNSWGTHCRGQHDQLEVCENTVCKLDGGWSGWGAWGPCSKSCGAGKRSRSRSCTRPEPSGSGKSCSGYRTEVGSCHMAPCKTFSHTVAVFNGESFLQYDFANKRSTMFQFYVRFLPLSPNGMLVRRGDVHNPLVRLSLQKWHLCLDAGGLSRSCTGPRICTPAVIEPAVWHSALITVSSEATLMRLNNEPAPLRSTFSCDPELPNEKMDIVVGEKLHGEIQEIFLNFIPLSLIVNRSHTRTTYRPTWGFNVAYERAGIEEGYLLLDNDHYLRLPCFDNQDEWKIAITLKTLTDTGTILFLVDETAQIWLHLYLQNMRLKLKLALADFRSESISSCDCPSNQWLDIMISKKRDANAIETSINVGERLHVIFEDDYSRKRSTTENKTDHKFKSPKISSLVICADEYYVGGVPLNIIGNVAFEDFTPLSCIIASVIQNDVILDINNLSVERYKDDKEQVSSRTASVSGSYYETAWGKSNRLNLTCLHARSANTHNSAHWLFLDTVLEGALQDKTVRSLDDGRILKLVATADNDLRGFYTCRAHSKKRTRNIVTYGVIGQINYRLSGPDFTTAIAVVTTVALVLGTLVCLFIEGFHDIRTGYGFYRDAHFTPEEEAEAVCKYIDQNMHLMADQNSADIAKARARRIARQMACHSNYSAQEPEGLLEVENLYPSGESIPSEPDGLPALPEIRSSIIEPMHEAFKCEQNYVSSPRDGTLSSPSELTSPRVLYSRLLLARHLQSSRDSLISRKKKSRKLRKSKSKLLTIKSSAYVVQSPAQKILQKFRELKSEDTPTT